MSTPDCACTFYFPPPGGSLAPFEWEPCSGNMLQDVDCQVMTSTAGGQKISVHGSYWTASPATLAVYRAFPATPSRVEIAFGALDGAVWAVDAPYQESCRVEESSTFDGRYVFGTSNDKNATHGVVAGRQGQLPELMRANLANVTGLISDWGASDTLVYRDAPGAIFASQWLPEDGQTAYTPSMDADSLPGFLHYLRGGDAFFEVTAAGHSGFLSWTQSTGIRPLLRTPHDSSRGFQNLWTDGSTLVFTYGEGATSQYKWARRAVYAAPYTTDPQALAVTAKMLTALPPTNTPDPWGVGCGYAALGIGDDDVGVSLVVVRLSDGAWWRKWPKDPFTSGGINALGATCDEIVFSNGKGMPTRVRLDSLGEPMAPVPPELKQPPF